MRLFPIIASLAISAAATADVTLTICDDGTAFLDPPAHSPVLFSREWPSLIDGELSGSVTLEDGTQIQCITGIHSPDLPGGRVVVTGPNGEFVQLQAAFPAATTDVVRTDYADRREYLLQTNLPPWRAHPGDFNYDGRLTSEDVFEFLACWFSGDTRADVDGFAGLSVGDIYEFLAQWASLSA